MVLQANVALNFILIAISLLCLAAFKVTCDNSLIIVLTVYMPPPLGFVYSHYLVRAYKNTDIYLSKQIRHCVRFVQEHGNNLMQMIT